MCQTLFIQSISHIMMHLFLTTTLLEPTVSASPMYWVSLIFLGEVTSMGVFYTFVHCFPWNYAKVTLSGKWIKNEAFLAGFPALYHCPTSLQAFKALPK